MFETKNKLKIFSRAKNLNNLFISLVFIITFLLVFMNKTDSIIIKKIKNTGIDIIAPISFIVSYPFESVIDMVYKIQSLKTLSIENDRLKEEVRRLQQWKNLSLSLVSENKAYKQLLNFEDVNLQLLQTVKVLNITPKMYISSIQLGGGTNNQISKDLAIVNERGLIGKVIETGKYTSRVLLISDINSSVPVKVFNQDIHAIVTGHSSNKILKLKFIKGDKKIKIGDVLVTSGNAGIFPKNIAVGKVFQIKNDQFFIKPFVDFNNLDFVQVVNEKSF